MKLINLIIKRNNLNYKKFQYAAYYCENFERELQEKQKTKTDIDYSQKTHDLFFEINKKQDDLNKQIIELKGLVEKIIKTKN